MYERPPPEEIPAVAITSKGDGAPSEFTIDIWNNQRVTAIGGPILRFWFEHSCGFPFLYACDRSSSALRAVSEAEIASARAFAEKHYAGTDGRRSAPRRAA